MCGFALLLHTTFGWMPHLHLIALTAPKVARSQAYTSIASEKIPKDMNNIQEQVVHGWSKRMRSSAHSAYRGQVKH